MDSFLYNFIYLFLFLTVLGLHCCVSFFSSRSKGHSLVVVRRLLIVAFLLREHRL